MLVLRRTTLFIWKEYMLLIHLIIYQTLNRSTPDWNKQRSTTRLVSCLYKRYIDSYTLLHTIKTLKKHKQSAIETMNV